MKKTSRNNYQMKKKNQKKIRKAQMKLFKKKI